RRYWLDEIFHAFALTAEYARERAVLAEQVSQLQEESDRLKRRIQELECSEAWPLAGLSMPSKEDHHPERTIGLDFSLPEDRNKE
ncbi:hypothetical protein, partial [Halomonas sp. 3A7M]|uniref:hypothetical protein n=1 Tax=Halomonas sp. 3A7M TaxID=2742616 RepID=UPI0018680355